MVGAVRFELTTSCTRNKRASQATLRPDPGQEKVPVDAIIGKKFMEALDGSANVGSPKFETRKSKFETNPKIEFKNETFEQDLLLFGDAGTIFSRLTGRESSVR